jgi:mono/diheme cytochrome c family protein
MNAQFPNPPTLHSDKVRNWADANIYHVISNGQNVMPSYAKQISRDDRWAIVNYIRVLQRSQNAKDSDIPVLPGADAVQTNKQADTIK